MAKNRIVFKCGCPDELHALLDAHFNFKYGLRLD